MISICTTSFSPCTGFPWSRCEIYPKKGSLILIRISWTNIYIYLVRSKKNQFYKLSLVKMCISAPRSANRVNVDLLFSRVQVDVSCFNVSIDYLGFFFLCIESILNIQYKRTLTNITVFGIPSEVICLRTHIPCDAIGFNWHKLLRKE